MDKTVIYIMSEFFAPFQNVGSVKFTKIVKYLSYNNKYRIIVFTRKNHPENDALLENDLLVMKENGVEIYYLDEGKSFYKTPNKLERTVRNRIKRLKDRIWGAESTYYHFYQHASKRFVAEGLNIIEQGLPLPHLIISTYDDWASHYLALEIKRQHPETIWIADFRDPVGAQIKSGKYRQLCDEYSMEVSKYADCITAVSKGCLESIQLQEGTYSCIATNGFDYDDYIYATQNMQKKKNLKLRFAYTGSFYGHSLIPFFNAIKELMEENSIDGKYIEIIYAGLYEKKVYDEIKRVGLEDVYNYKGSLSRVDAIRLQDDVDILLTSVWNRKDYKGVIGGKFLTYLMLKKPIIAVVTGDEPDSEIKKMINAINCGWCYEEANHDKDFDELKNVIKCLYDEKMCGSDVGIAYNEKSVEKYNLKNIAFQYERLYEDIKLKNEQKSE